MKKLVRILCMALALIMIAGALIGCDRKTAKSTDEQMTENEQETAKSSLTINGVELESYTVVYNAKEISGAKKALSYLNEKLGESYNTELTGEKSSRERYEILIGLDGGDADIAQEYAKTECGLIGATDKKIVLLGANYSVLCRVIDAFLGMATDEDGSAKIDVAGSVIIPVSKDSLTVMTYNILSNMEKEGRPEDCRARMTDTILENDVDVLGTQEDGEEHSAAFIQLLGSYSVFKGDIEEGNCIYWKTDKFNLKKKGYFYLSDTPTIKSKYDDSNHYRTMSYVILEVKETGKQFLFINTHTDYRAQEATRTKQLSVLTSLIKKINKDNLPTVVLGDLNTYKSIDGGVSLLTFLSNNKHIKLAYDVAESKGDTGSTLINNFTTRNDPYIFDYILVSIDSICTKYYTVVDNIKDGKYPSDHLPVLAQIDIY